MLGWAKIKFRTDFFKACLALSLACLLFQSKASAFLQDCGVSGVGQPCNLYGDVYVPGVGGTCDASLHCVPNDMSTCRSDCLYEYDHNMAGPIGGYNSWTGGSGGFCSGSNICQCDALGSNQSAAACVAPPATPTPTPTAPPPSAPSFSASPASGYVGSSVSCSSYSGSISVTITNSGGAGSGCYFVGGPWYMDSNPSSYAAGSSTTVALWPNMYGMTSYTGAPWNENWGYNTFPIKIHCNEGDFDVGSFSQAMCNVGQHWDGSSCVNDCSPTAYSGVGAWGDTCNGGGCAANASLSSTTCYCNSGYYDNGSNSCSAWVCTPNNTYSDSSGCSNAGTRTITCNGTGSGYTSGWSGCTCNSGLDPATNCASCPSGSFWNGSSCQAWVCTPNQTYSDTSGCSGHGTRYITCNGSGSGYTSGWGACNCAGGWTGGSCQLSPVSLSFSGASAYLGTVNVGTTTGAYNVTINNSGGTNASGCSVSIGDGSNFILSNQANCSTVIGGSSCYVTVYGYPQSVNYFATQLSISCSNGSAGSAGGGLSTTGQTQPSLSFSPNSINFGSVYVNTSSGASTVTVSNGGSVTATGCTVSISDTTNFSVSQGSCGSVPGYGTCSFSVYGNPTTEGAKGTTYSISCSNGSASSAGGATTVTGISHPSLSMSPGSIAFGRVQVGTTSGASTITVSNTGTDSATGCTVYVNDGTNFTNDQGSCATVPGKGSCTFNVYARPQSTTALSTNAVISCSGGYGASTPGGGITTTGFTYPSLSFSGDTYNFGTVLVGASTGNTTVTINNAGSDSATGCSMSISDPTNFTLSNSGNCSTVPGYGSCQVQVRANAQSTGAKSANLNISCTYNGSYSSTSGGLYQVGATLPSLSFSPNTYDFGSVLLGSSSGSATFTVTNTGTLSASSCSVTITDPTNFTLQNAGNCATVPGSGSCQVQVKANPTAVGPFSTSLAISCSGPSSGYTGTYTGPFNSNTTPNGIITRGDTPPSVAFSPLGVDFGYVSIGTSSAAYVFTVNNSGSIGATGCTVSISDTTNFTLQSPGNCSSIAGYGSCTFGVVANPPASGPKYGTLSINCSSYLGNTVAASGSSNGVKVIGSTPVNLSFSPNTYSFGTVMIGSTSSVGTFTFTNSGSTSATGCTVSISDPTDFGIQNPSDCASVPGNGSCILNLVAHPASTGNLSTNASISCSGGVNLSSTAGGITVLGATPPSLTFSPASFNIGNVYVGSSSGVNTVTISNSGTTAATSCAVTLGDNTNFTLTNATNCNTVPATGSCTIDVYGNPKSTGTFATRLNISCASSVAGNSTTNGITVVGAIAPTPATLTVAPNLVDFGSVATGSTTATNSFIIRNTGTTAASGCSVSLAGNNPGDFILSNEATCSTISGSGNCTVYVAARPTSNGLKSTHVSVSCASSVGASSTANGITATGATPPSLAFESNAISFGNMTTGTASSDERVVLKNTGGVTAKNCVVTIGDTTNFNRTLVSSCSSISPNSSCNLTVKAQPQVPGTLQTNLSVSCADGITATSLTNGIVTTAATPPPTCTGGQYWAGTACKCPFGYSLSAGNCVPNAPSAEYYTNASGYPVCGSGRLPTTYTLSALNIAGSQEPRTSLTAVVNGYTYPYASIAGTANAPYPSYYYNTQPHCACSNHTTISPILGTAVTNLSNKVSGGSNRFAGDTLDYIASFDSNGIPNKSYGQIAINKNDTSIDGRLGSEFGTGRSTCGCPNVNEVATLIDPSDPVSGVICAPPASLKNDPNVAFVEFDNVKDASQVMTSEPTDSSGKVIDKVMLPVSQSSPQTLTSYTRRIWKCQLGYTLDTSTGACVWSSGQNMCNSSSPLSSGSTWGNTVNKKLACCMNDGGSSVASSSSVKYDCVDNSSSASSNFNTLWSSSDNAADGGQMNALLLVNSGGKPITGFYTLEGARCNEFSEFSNTTIQPGVINQTVQAGQQLNAAGSASSLSFQAVGSAITMPSGQGWVDITTGLGTKATAPNPSSGTQAEINKANRCPILVRAAMVVSCPKNPTGRNVPKFTVSDTNGFTRSRCPAAASIQVHIRAEQIFTVAGKPPMKTVDTIVDNKTAATMNMDQILRKKDGFSCLPGLKFGSSGCQY